MYIEIKEIGPEGLTIDRTVEPFRLPTDGGDSIRVDRVDLSGELRKESDGVFFAGRIEGAATMPCSRCVDECALPLLLPFDLFYTTEPEGAEVGGHHTNDDRITRVEYDGVRIDLRALLSEQIYLGLPLKPLCRPDCLGLCPRCGTNLNSGECACAEKRTEDPRLRVLKNLL